MSRSLAAIALALLPLVAAPSAAAGGQRPAASEVLVGVNQQWNTQAGFDAVLADADLARLRDAGARAVRIVVRCHAVRACAYDRRYDDGIDYAGVRTWDLAALDAAVRRVRDAGMEPIIGLHPGDRMWRPGWIVDDGHHRSTRAFVETVARHLHRRFGPLAYSFYETELDTSMHDGRYRYTTAEGFPRAWRLWLAGRYRTVAALNAEWDSRHPSFADVPVPDLGDVGRSVESPAAAALRRAIAETTASRYSGIGALLHRVSPGSEWWGPTVQVQSLHTARDTHTAASPTPVGPTLEDLAAQPAIDVLSVDGYRGDPWLAAADWRVASKVAARAGKRLAITEIGAADDAGFAAAVAGVRAGASNLRAVLVWQGRDVADGTTFGLLDRSGRPRTARLHAVRRLAGVVADRAAYRFGGEPVLYPGWSLDVVQHGKAPMAKTIRLMADLLAAGVGVEPVSEADLAAGRLAGRIVVHSLYVRADAAAELGRRRAPVVAVQYASFRTGFAAGRPVDSAEVARRLGIAVSSPEAAGRQPGTLRLLGETVPVGADLRLGGWPFVRLGSAGATTVVATWDGRPAGVRAADGSAWLEVHPGPALALLLR